jgi:PadR family transcriptional regulator
MADPTAWRYGYELGQEVGLRAGSLYPILMRLTDRGFLEATWEEPGDDRTGRPPRHLYRLNAAGQAYAVQWAAPEAARPARGELRTAW